MNYKEFFVIDESVYAQFERMLKADLNSLSEAVSDRI